MTSYNVFANDCDFGVIDANSTQEARNIAAQMAGYKSEQDMESQLDCVSEFVVEAV